MAQVTLHGDTIHTNGHLPTEGSRAPDFKLVDKDLGDRSLKDFGARKKLLNIVPSLDTPTCATSAKRFDEFAQAHKEAVILTIYADLPFAMSRFCGAEGVDNVITLSMMRSQAFAEDYGVLIEDGPLAGIAARAVLVLDENDKIIYSELVPEIAREPDYDKAIAALG